MRAVTLLALCGCVSFAGAQSALVALTADKTTALVGEDVTWTLSIDWSWSGHADAYLGGFNIDLTSSLAGTGGVFGEDAGITADSNLTLGYGPAGGVFGADYLQLVFTDLATLSTGRPGGGADPFAVGTFTVQYGAEGDASYSAAGVPGQDALTLAEGAFLTLITEIIDPFGVSSDTVTITPTPASIALIGLGGLVAVRRRR